MAKQLNRSSRFRWQQHIDAQVGSGLSQAAYCREHQLNEKYFSLWKGKLRKVTTSAVADVTSIGLIPVVVKNASKTNAECSAPTTSVSPSIYIDMKLTFPNGVAMELRLPNETVLLPFIIQLIQLPC
jgi:hypothetical protein